MEIQKHRLIFLVALTIVLTSSISYAYAVSQQYYINAYSGVSEYDYIIFKIGSTYYAKSGQDGSYISSTNASYIINTAIYAVFLNGGGTVFLKIGTYYLTHTVLLYSKVDLVGESREGTILTVANGTPDKFIHISTETPLILFNSITEGYDVNLDSFTIRTNALEINYELNPIVLFSSHQRFTIRNLLIDGFDGTDIAGIYDRLGLFDTIENNIILNGGIDGGVTSEAIYLYLTSLTLIKGNYIYNMSREGIYLSDTSQIIITDNIFKLILAEGIDLKQNSNVNIISNNEFYSSSNGVWCASKYNIISSNIFRGGSGYAIALDAGGATSANAYANTISGNNIYSYEYSIYLGDIANYTTITGNVISDGGEGLTLSETKYNSISGNNYVDMDYGVRIKDASDWNTITGDSISYCQNGLLEEGSGNDYNNIANIKVSGSTTVNILMYGSNGTSTNRITSSWNSTSWISRYGYGT